MEPDTNVNASSDWASSRDLAAQKEQEFLRLAECFRIAADLEEIKRLGDEMGRMVFGLTQAA